MASAVSGTGDLDFALSDGEMTRGGDDEATSPAGSLSDATRRREAVRERSLRTLRRRRLLGRVANGACAGALALSLVPLVALGYYLIERGMHALSWDFFVHDPTPAGIPGGGIADAIAGTLVVIGVAMAIAIPVALLVALFLVDRSGPVAGALRFSADVLTGVPSIALGIFAYALIVTRMHHFSAFAGSFALAVLMLPIMIRADEEAMRTVAVDLWEAGMALGARRSRVIRSVVLREALPGLVTGNLLAIARGIGETAPILFVIGGGLTGSVNWNPFNQTSAMPVTIFGDGTQAFPAAQLTAWGTALVLVALVLVLSIVARIVAARLTRHAR
ncbi:MAG TPA: phosphate ABC transporter permease PstA [Acidimicrobiales bacterium]|nr:phosphate ABC transporter permease PstA [Acidimicrobiales bacterium]